MNLTDRLTEAADGRELALRVQIRPLGEPAATPPLPAHATLDLRSATPRVIFGPLGGDGGSLDQHRALPAPSHSRTNSAGSSPAPSLSLVPVDLDVSENDSGPIDLRAEPARSIVMPLRSASGDVATAPTRPVPPPAPRPLAARPTRSLPVDHTPTPAPERKRRMPGWLRWATSMVGRSRDDVATATVQHPCPNCETAGRVDISNPNLGTLYLSCPSCFNMWQESKPAAAAE